MEKRVLILLVILTVPIAYAVPAYVQSGYGECYPATSCDVEFGVPGVPGVDVTEGSLLVMTTRTDNNAGNEVQSVTSVPVCSWARDVQQYSSTGFWLEVWSCPNAPAGDYTVTVKVGSPADQMRIVLTEYSGIAASGHVDGNPVSDTHVDSACSDAGPITTTLPNSLIHAVGAADGNHDAYTFTPGAGYTVHDLGGDPSGSDKTMTQHRVAAAPGTYNTEMCNINDNCAGAAVAYAASGSCQPQCTGRECGDDGCGGLCFPGCSSGETCSNGNCITASSSYWVSPTGSASWASCKSASPLSGNSACSLSTANSNAKAGDTVMMRAGSYSSRIQPSNSGSAGSYISYEAYNNEGVVLTSNRAIYLINNQYIRIAGVRADLNQCTSMGCYVEIDNSNNNLIEACELTNIKSQSGWPNGVLFRNNAHHNVFRNNRIGNAGWESAGPEDAGGTMRLGSDAGDDGSGHNLFEGNELFNGGHHVIEVYTSYNVFRNNLIHNSNWYPCSQPGGYCGNRNLIFDGPLDDAGHNILENNRIAFAGIPADSVSGSGISLRSGNNIIRYNTFYHGTGPAMSIEQYGYWGQPHDVSFNHIYNNVFYHNGYFEQSGWWAAHYGMLIADQDYSGIKDLKIKNNIFFDNQAGPIAWSHSAKREDQEMANNLEGPNPLFVNTNTDGPDSWVLPDFSLQASSPAIDAGAQLTFVAPADSGTGIQLQVDNAGYFQDSSWVMDGLMEADWIAVGSTGNAVQIESISGNTITLANSISRSDNDPVFLYRKSDGEQVLYGSASDIGAKEYQGGCLEVTTQQLVTKIDQWKNGQIGIISLMQQIQRWKNGC